MRNFTALFASLLAASTLVASPTFAQSAHAPMGGPRPSGEMGGPHEGPSMGAPAHGAAPGHVLMGPHWTPGYRGNFAASTSMRMRPFVFQHHDFTHFTAAERSTWQSGWWHHGWWHGRWGWWWFAGGYWWWYDAPVYPWPTFVSDVDYVEPTYESDYGSWYYCANPPGYYPYVQSCNGPWQPVAPTPEPGYDQGGPQGGPDQGPPPGYQGDDQGPPPGAYDQGPPPSGYDQGPPPGYSDQGPPPGDEQGPPPPPPPGH